MKLRKHVLSEQAVPGLGCALVLILALIGAGCRTSNYVTISGTKDPSTGKPIVVPKKFFQDSQVAKELDASLKLTAGQLFGATNVGLDASLKNVAKIYAEVFDAYTRDLRTTVEANYNGFVTALSQADNSPERMQYKAQYDEILKQTSERTAQLRVIQLQVKAYSDHPSTNGLVDIGQSVRALLADSLSARQSTVSPDRISDALKQLRDDMLGNSEHPRSFWRYNPDQTGSIVVPLRLSGATRITDNIDLSPFMKSGRKVKVVLQNVDSAGRKDFLCHVKSDRPGDDGDRQVNNAIQVKNGDVVSVEKSEMDDVAYYLAWRGETMTKEEFRRRYPTAEIMLELLP